MNFATRPEFTDLFSAVWHVDRQQFFANSMTSRSYDFPLDDLNEVEVVCDIKDHAPIYIWVVKNAQGKVSVSLLGDGQGPTEINRQSRPAKGLLLRFERDADRKAFEKMPR